MNKKPSPLPMLLFALLPILGTLYRVTWGGR